MSERQLNSGENYRYGFNGQEKVDEISGAGNHTTATFWEYDTRIGRRWNQDPKPNPSFSNYATFANNPIWNTDFAGDTAIVFIDKDGAGGQGHIGTAFQNGKGEWYYASQGAGGNPSQSSLLAGSDTEGGLEIIPLKIQQQIATKDANGNIVKDDQGNTLYTTVLRNPTKEEVISVAQSGQLGYAYDDNIVLNSSKTQDAQITKNSFKLQRDYNAGREEYNLYFNNCADAMQDIIQTKTNIDLPIDFDPRPNEYFNKLKSRQDDINGVRGN